MKILCRSSLRYNAPYQLAAFCLACLCRSCNACPMRAMDDWLQESDTRFGPVFRKVDRRGTVEHARLGPDGLRRIIARRTAARGTRSKAG